MSDHALQDVLASSGGSTEAGDGAPAAVVQAFRTDGVLAARAPDVAADAVELLGRADVRDGQWFVLGADGMYDVDLNRFFRELDGWGVRSANGIAAYVSDVMLFCRFLHESRGGATIWECDGADLRAYKAVRLRADGPHRVSVSTWRRSVAALDKWVQWSLYEGLLEREPFRRLDWLVLMNEAQSAALGQGDRQPR